MSNVLKDLAKKSVSLGRIMSDCSSKIETADIIKYNPNGITITDFEKVNISDEDVYVYTIKEYVGGFAFAGLVLKKMFDEIIEGVGSYELALKTLQEEGGLKVKLIRDKTKDGKKELTKVEVID